MNVLKSSVFSNILFLSACGGSDSIEPTPPVVQSPIYKQFQTFSSD